MSKFTDVTSIRIKAGDGGPGAVSFRREKYVPKGGPDGGDGGKGGDVYIVADRRYYNLSHFFKDRLYKAGNGQHGMGSNKHGKDGEDLIIKVPPGTVVYNDETGEMIVDLMEEDTPFKIAIGGIGGMGNAFFKTSTHQTPRFAQDGMPGEELYVSLNLKLIADVGFVGLPNAGKSTLLSVITNANPKIGDYPFTTLTPNLGVIDYGDGTVYKIADIPGIIEGAHMGHGLGLSFLQHIERVRCILYIIDVTGDDLKYTHELLKSELDTYNTQLVHKKNRVVFTKTDLISPEELEEKIQDFGGDIIPVSALSDENIKFLISEIRDLMEKQGDKE
ncbi:MAG TPA: GTPase ObgE [Spirochaetota bacterium]|nr:GTPase ObgE [Spirochaetota bacterium]HPJ40855.1 GTPase ObgE [Spirochaetota bacterium]HPR37164.1 GTPase ObgE [Spirochaetota bacterium]HRX46515.1 GTPase ObgE [Spirochaetota bacterium]